MGSFRVGQEWAMPDQKFSDGKVAILSFNNLLFNNFKIIITLVSLVQFVLSWQPSGDSLHCSLL